MPKSGAAVTATLRHTMLSAVVLCITAGLSAAAAEEVFSAARQASEAEPTKSDASKSPLGVVNRQMQALSEWVDDPTAAARVFALASPANRAVTGPLERFRALVEGPRYEALLKNRGWIAGSPITAGDAAVVLVTLIDTSGNLRAFRFYLARQPDTEQPTWMTDAVIALPLAMPAPNPRATSERSGTI